jgi:P-type conjugative transfer protein TrbG
MIGRFFLLAALSVGVCPASAQQGEDGDRAPTIAAECASTRRSRCPTPLDMVAAANAEARQGPRAGGFVAARQVYAYESGALYELYASPGFVSMILLEPGEAINAVAAGDTSRWMVTESETEADATPRAVVLVKPQAGGLRTNIVLITDRRTYLVEARSAPGNAYTAQLAWTYPPAAPSEASSSVETLDFRYSIRTVRGRSPAWTPARVYNDGRRTWIDFPARVAAADLPPLFVIIPEGPELVNYRVEHNRYVVDRLFDIAELRLGVRAPIIVRIERGDRVSSRMSRGARR